MNTDTARIFYLYFIMDMTLKQIAEELGTKESTVKSNLYRMLKNVKKTFLGGGSFEE